MCFLLYTGGDNEKLDCVARAACESPVSADRFVQAGKMWYKMHSIIQAVPFNHKYHHIMEKVNEATAHGLSPEDNTTIVGRIVLRNPIIQCSYLPRREYTRCSLWLFINALFMLDRFRNSGAINLSIFKKK